MVDGFRINQAQSRYRPAGVDETRGSNPQKTGRTGDGYPTEPEPGEFVPFGEEDEKSLKGF